MMYNVFCINSVTMEDENITSIVSGNNNDPMKEEEEEEEEDTNVPLPGFRFHPTDEELVGFYLRRKVENKKITLELIKHADIYKHDPWDLPKLCSSAGDKEWYFYCKRGRKYKNSVRPNRVTSSGFWKATGIDKPVYSSSSADHHDIIGLKKSLVYYRGSSGKGTKTDWMMHEFRLPPACDNANDQEAEVWTLCRVFKRSSTASNYCKRSSVASDSRQASGNNSKRLRSDDINTNTTAAASKTSISSYYSDDDHQHHHMNYISFDAPVMKPLKDISSGGFFHYCNFPENSSSSSLSSSDEITPFGPPFQGDHFNNDMLSLGTDYNWDDLRSLVSCDTVHANVVHPSFYV